MTTYTFTFQEDKTNGEKFSLNFRAHKITNAITNAKRYARKNNVIFIHPVNKLDSL